MPSSYEALTENFYRWEKRARGWRVWSHPVELEPPFLPFYHHYGPAPRSIDDGRKATALSKFVGRILGKDNDRIDEPTFFQDGVEQEPEPLYCSEANVLVPLRINLPPD